MNSPKASDTARISAAIALLDRGWGKPKEMLEITRRDRPVTEMTDEELEAIASGEDVNHVGPSSLDKLI